MDKIKVTLGREISPRAGKQQDDLWDTRGKFIAYLEKFCKEKGYSWKTHNKGKYGCWITGQMDKKDEKEIRDMLMFDLENVINDHAKASAVKRITDQLFKDSTSSDEYWAQVMKDYNLTKEQMVEVAKDYENLVDEIYNMIEDSREKRLISLSPSNSKFSDTMFKLKEIVKDLKFQTSTFVKFRLKDSKKVKDSDTEDIAKELVYALEDDFDITFDQDQNGWFISADIEELEEVDLVSHGENWLKIHYPQEYREELVEIFETQGVIRIVCS